jgi:hypothetical protein
MATRFSTTLNPDEDVPHLNGGPFAAARGRDARESGVKVGACELRIHESSEEF